MRGAFLSLNDPCAELSDVDHPSLIVTPIISSTTTSLSGRISTLENAEILSLLEKMTGAAVKSLPQAGLAGSSTSQARTSVASATVAAVMMRGTPVSAMSFG